MIVRGFLKIIISAFQSTDYWFYLSSLKSRLSKIKRFSNTIKRVSEVELPSIKGMEIPLKSSVLGLGPNVILELGFMKQPSKLWYINKKKESGLEREERRREGEREKKKTRRR